MILRKSSKLALVALVTLLASAPAQAGFFPRLGKFTLNGVVVTGAAALLYNLKERGFGGTRPTKAMVLAQIVAAAYAGVRGLQGMKDAIFADEEIEDVEDMA